MKKEDILNFLQQNRDYLRNNFSVEKIGIFGSYAKEKATNNSDIDFYVILKNKTLDNMTSLWIYLEKKFNKKVDIIYHHPRLREGLKKQIEKEVIYG